MKSKKNRYASHNGSLSYLYLFIQLNELLHQIQYTKHQMTSNGHNAAQVILRYQVLIIRTNLL